MPNENRTNGKKSRKPLALLLAVTLLVVCAAGGTIAWLTSTESIMNTFHIGSVDVELVETPKEYKLVPGHVIAKDPAVIVKADTVDSWVFVKIAENGVPKENPQYNLADFIDYAVAEGWAKLGSDSTVYYRKAETGKEDQKFPVLGGGTYEDNDVTYTWGDNQVLTLPTVTEEMMAFLQERGQKPELTFTAYAVQYRKNDTANFTAEEAWNLIKSGKLNESGT